MKVCDFLEPVIQMGARVFLLTLLGACASSGPQRLRSFFQAVDLAKAGEKEQAQEAFRSACSQYSSAACHRIGRRAERSKPLPILQGATDETNTEVVLLVPEGQQVQVFLWDMTQSTLVEPRNVTPVALPDGLGKILQHRFEKLSLGTVYQLQVVGPAGELLDGRELKTLEVSKKRGIIAVASCMDDTHPNVKTAWLDLLKQEPDAIFLIGDNVYADKEAMGVVPPLATLWRRYVEVRNRLELFKAARLVPIFAGWDDHDYGVDNGDRTFPHRLEVRKIFKAFFGEAEYPGVYDRGPGVSARLNAFGQRFFFLDDRSFRSPLNDKQAQTHFGPDQEAWLFTELYGDTPTWLISGDQFFGAYHGGESYEGSHPQSFQRFIKRLRTQAAPILFLSGDQHLAEMMKIPADVLGYETYEITTSPIHGSVNPGRWKEIPNPRQIEAAAGSTNYAVLETEVSATLSLYVKVYGPSNRRLFARGVEVRR